MLTVTNSLVAQSVTAIAPADLKVAQFAKIVAPATAGDQPKLAKIVEADLTDPSALIGIVGWTSLDSEAADFVVGIDGSLSLYDGEKGTVKIPAGAPCVLYFGKPTVRIHKDLLDESIAFATLVGGENVAINAANSLLGAHDEDTDARSVIAGKVLRIDGPEVLVSLHAI